jgi:rare lipoprotein A
VPCRRLPVEGIASWYGWHWEGRLTANGDRFRALGKTAASLTIPLGSWITVTNLDNARSEVIEVNDRGPYVVGRIIDLSLGTALALGIVDQGLARVRIEPFCGDPPQKRRKSRRVWDL